MLHQSGNILDIAKAICSHSTHIRGFVSQHRVHLLMQSLCPTAHSCKPGLVVSALRIACNGLCTAARFHTAEDNPGCRLGCLEEQDCLRHYNSCQKLFRHPSWLGTIEVSRAPPFSMIYFSKLLFEVTDFASSSLDYWTRALQLSSICEGPTVVPSSISRN